MTWNLSLVRDSMTRYLAHLFRLDENRHHYTFRRVSWMSSQGPRSFFRINSVVAVTKWRSWNQYCKQKVCLLPILISHLQILLTRTSYVTEHEVEKLEGVVSAYTMDHTLGDLDEVREVRYRPPRPFGTYDNALYRISSRLSTNSPPFQRPTRY